MNVADDSHWAIDLQLQLSSHIEITSRKNNRHEMKMSTKNKKAKRIYRQKLKELPTKPDNNYDDQPYDN